MWEHPCRRGVARNAAVALFPVAVLLAGCGQTRAVEDSGSASYTVTYEDSDGREVVAEVEVRGLDCTELGKMRTYEDASAPDHQPGDRGLTVMASRDPAVDGEFMAVYLPFGDGLVFQSLDLFEADEDGFEFAELEGVARAADSPNDLISATATADGSGVC